MEAVLTLKTSGLRPGHERRRKSLFLRLFPMFGTEPETSEAPTAFFDQDLERAQMLLRTITYFWRGPGNFSLTVITPPEDVITVRNALTSTAAIEVAVVDENELIPFQRLGSGLSPWYKQQVLKLAFATLATEEFFLTLDADLLCTHEISDKSFVEDGRALTDWEPRSLHPQWWATSAKLLRLPVQAAGAGLSVTPALLSRTICTQLTNHITGIAGEDWYKYLLARFGWTEYSLYNLFADNNGLTYRYHHAESWMLAKRKSIRADVNNSRNQNFWSEHQFGGWKGDDAFNPEAQGLFIVCQSNSNIMPSAVWDRIKHRLPGSSPDHLYATKAENSA